mgnify:CR=1 FL=1
MVLNLSNLTNNFSGVPLAFAFMIMLGNSGVFIILAKKFGVEILMNFNLYSWAGLLLMYVYFQIPLGVMLLFPTLQGIKEELKQAAFLLGASSFEFWRYVGLPIILPGIVGVFSILFANAMGAYASAIAVVLAIILILALLLNDFMMKKVRRDI